MERTFILARARRGVRDRTVLAGGSAFLALPGEVPPGVHADVLDAIRRAYQAGRDDRSAELIPPGFPDILRAMMLGRALGAIREWMPGWLPGDGLTQHRITLDDEDDNDLTMSIGTQWTFPLRRFRLRVLIEQLEGK